MTPGNRHLVLASVLAPGLLVGCNALLSIDAPKSGELSPVVDDSIADTGKGDGGSGGKGSGDSDQDETPVISEEDPSPYAWATWPMPNPGTSGVSNPQTFGVRSTGVVFDSVTKLEWQQRADSKERTRDEAEAYCDSLSVAGGGFRLPSRIELLSIVDFTRTNPSIDAKAFPDAASGKYWSSSRYAGSAESGWLVNFAFGTGLVFIEQAENAHVARCVREQR